MLKPEIIKKHPFYLKVTVIMFGMVLFVYILYNLRDILVPLSFALLLAILLNPITIMLEKWRFPKVLAIVLSILLAMILIVAISYFLIMEIRSFSDELPAFKEKMASLLLKVQHMARRDFGINIKQQNEYLNEAENGLKPLLTSALGSAMGILSMFFLLPIYAFLFLFYKDLIMAFLFQLFEKVKEQEISVVLNQTKGAIQSYMYGLLLEALIVASLNTLALLILGIQYAVLLGVLGALLNILPFIGGILAVLFPILIATVTKDGFHTQVWIIVAYLIIQFIDNHFLMPYIVASKVKINALISIIVVLLGGALWGFSGMFLSIPFVGVLKIIFDKLQDLRPWGMLIGMEIPTRRKNKLVTMLKRS